MGLDKPEPLVDAARDLGEQVRGICIADVREYAEALRAQQEAISKQIATSTVIVHYRIGVGLRIIATFTARASSIDLGNLYPLGLAAQAPRVGMCSPFSCGIAGV